MEYQKDGGAEEVQNFDDYAKNWDKKIGGLERGVTLNPSRDLLETPFD